MFSYFFVYCAPGTTRWQRQGPRMRTQDIWRIKMNKSVKQCEAMCGQSIKCPHIHSCRALTHLLTFHTEESEEQRLAVAKAGKDVRRRDTHGHRGQSQLIYFMLDC